MVKTRVLVLILLVVLVVSVALCLVFFLPKKSDRSLANVYVDGQLVLSVDLSKRESFVRTVETPYGNNSIQVEDGKIRVLDADCPDKVCVRSGWRTAGGAPIVCLPHKLVIKMESNGEVDAVSQ